MDFIIIHHCTLTALTLRATAVWQAVWRINKWNSLPTALRSTSRPLPPLPPIKTTASVCGPEGCPWPDFLTQSLRANIKQEHQFCVHTIIIGRLTWWLLIMSIFTIYNSYYLLPMTTDSIPKPFSFFFYWWFISWNVKLLFNCQKSSR